LASTETFSGYGLRKSHGQHWLIQRNDKGEQHHLLGHSLQPDESDPNAFGFMLLL